MTLRRSDFYICLFFLGLSSAVFLLPAIFNHVLMPGDDAIQNFPLRVLSGKIISLERLPLLDVFSWSGSPLLAGFNAGSLYPGTLLFAILNVQTSWVINEILAYFMAASGTYLYARYLGIRPLASFIAATSFSSAGSMAAQLPHIDLVQAMGYLGFLLIFLEMQLKNPLSFSGPILLALSALLALLFLTGSTRGISDVLIILAARLIIFYIKTTNFLGFTSILKSSAFYIVALIWSIGLSSIQLFPGFEYLLNSQRNISIPYIFTSGSPMITWIPLTFFPNLLGTSGSFYSPSFVPTNSNLPEVTNYIGILALVGILELLINFKRLSGDRKTNAFNWLVLAGLSYFLSFAGSIDGVSWLISHIPIYGSQRLQGRNFLIFDFCLAICTALFLEELFAKNIRAKFANYIALALAGFSLILSINPDFFIHVFTMGQDHPNYAQGLRPWWFLFAILAGFYFLYFRFFNRIGAKKLLLICLIIVDLSFFNLTSTLTVKRSGALYERPVAKDLRILSSKGISDNVSLKGRIGFWDPDLAGSDLIILGQPDANEFLNMTSVQGYASLTPALYNSVTKTHGTLILDPIALQEGAFSRLGLKTLYVSQGALVSPDIAPAIPNQLQPAPVKGRKDFRHFYIDPLINVDMLYIKTLKQIPEIRLISADRTTYNIKATKYVGNIETFKIVPGINAAEISLLPQYSVDSPTDITLVADHRNYYLSGPLQNAITPTSWTYQGIKNGLIEFKSSYPTNPLQPLSKCPGLKLYNEHLDLSGTLTFNIKCRKSVSLLWNEAYLSGYQGFVKNGSTQLPIDIKPSGIIQKIKIPKGSWQVTLYYRPSIINVCLWTEYSSIALFLLTAVLCILRRLLFN
jgi:hypothetical protein